MFHSHQLDVVPEPRNTSLTPGPSLSFRLQSWSSWPSLPLLRSHARVSSASFTPFTCLLPTKSRAFTMHKNSKYVCRDYYRNCIFRRSILDSPLLSLLVAWSIESILDGLWIAPEHGTILCSGFTPRLWPLQPHPWLSRGRRIGVPHASLGQIYPSGSH